MVLMYSFVDGTCIHMYVHMCTFIYATKTAVNGDDAGMMFHNDAVVLLWLL